MTSVSCRYCVFYAPSLHTPVWGYCAGEFPPKCIRADNKPCPFNHDKSEIEKESRARGFSGYDLRRLEYYGVSEDGFRTRFYSNLDDLRRDIKPSPLQYTLYVRFIDSDKHVFARAVIP